MNHSDSPSSQRQFNTRLGLILFVVYLLFYVGFVLINAFDADVMDSIALLGLNLAIVYGFGLIALAMLMAVVYGLLCRSEPVPRPDQAEGRQDGGDRQ